MHQNFADNSFLNIFFGVSANKFESANHGLQSDIVSKTPCTELFRIKGYHKESSQNILT